jgi:hypothetical protein
MLAYSLSHAGTLPGTVWSLNLVPLEKLNLRRNHLTGSLPSEWIGPEDVWPHMWYIDLRWNDLNGTYPTTDPGPHFRLRNRNQYNDPDNNHDPTIYLEPMNAGFGLCGPLPQIRSRIVERFEEDWTERTITELQTLPTCAVKTGNGYQRLMELQTLGSCAVKTGIRHERFIGEERLLACLNRSWKGGSGGLL